MNFHLGNKVKQANSEMYIQFNLKFSVLDLHVLKKQLYADHMERLPTINIIM